MDVRRAVTAARVILTAATALGAATFVTQVLALPGAATASPPAKAQPMLAQPATRDLEVEGGYALFGIERPLADASAADTTTCEEAQKTTLALRLVGTVVSPLPEASAASIDVGRAPATAEIFAVGERIAELAVLERIDSERVCLWNVAAGRRESLALGEVAAEATRPALPVTSKLVERTADGNLRVSRAALDAALSDPSALARTARFAPALKDGAVIGYKVASIAKGSPLVGVLEKGDVILRINGVPLSDMNKSLELLSTLRERADYQIEGRRGDRPLSLSVKLGD